MAKQIGEDTKVTLDLKTIGMIVAFVVTLAGMWFTLQADIAQAKELPAPVIDRVEYDLKDELIRQTIMDTQEDVEEIKETIDKIDQRLYDTQSKQVLVVPPPFCFENGVLYCMYVIFFYNLVYLLLK